jgi:hypothetical protein
MISLEDEIAEGLLEGWKEHLETLETQFLALDKAGLRPMKKESIAPFGPCMRSKKRRAFSIWRISANLRPRWSMP